MNRVCPRVPPGAQEFYDELMGYAVWMIGAIFAGALLINDLLIVHNRVQSRHVDADQGDGVGVGSKPSAASLAEFVRC